ncbi:1815_t:CDS:2, partial [Dentiscutata heterogama]
ARNLYDDIWDTAHATLCIVFQFEMPNINIALLASNVELCGKNPFQ